MVNVEPALGSAWPFPGGVRPFVGTALVDIIAQHLHPMRHLYPALLIGLFPTTAFAQLQPATGEFRVNQNVPSEQYLPQVAVGPADDYVVVWKSWLQDDNTASIYFRRYNSAHIALSAELLVATGAN